MEPDSEEIRRTLEPLPIWWERKSEWMMKGGETADVAVNNSRTC